MLILNLCSLFIYDLYAFENSYILQFYFKSILQKEKYEINVIHFIHYY